MAGDLATRLGALTALDEDDRAAPLGHAWESGPVVLAYGWSKTFHPRSMWKGLRAFAAGFRQGGRRGNPVQQGGLFVLGPGDRVRYALRDRFAGDHAPISAVLAALA